MIDVGWRERSKRYLGFIYSCGRLGPGDDGDEGLETEIRVSLWRE